MPVNVTSNVHFRPGGTSASGFPDSTNTGYRNAPGYTGSLTDGTGTVVTSNSTYSHMDFPGGLAIGDRDAYVTNVTLIGCRFHGNSQDSLVPLYGDGITLSYCSIEPVPAAPPVPYASSYQYGIQGDGGYFTSIEALTVEYCDIWGFGNAITCDGSTQAKPQVYRRNWVHDAAEDGGIYHTDGIGDLLNGHSHASYVVIDGNTIASVGNTNGIAFQGGLTGADLDHFTITNNLISGWGYSIQTDGGTGGSVTYMNVSGNTFSTALLPDWGPLYSNPYHGFPAPWQWRNNRWHVPEGAPWGHIAYDGYYWLPGLTSQAGPALDEVDAGLAGTEDYTE